MPPRTLDEMVGPPGRRGVETAPPAQKPRASVASLPQTIAPMRPAASPQPFDSTSHLFEAIWDGVRSLAFVERDHLRVQDAYGRDVTERYPELAAAGPHVHGSGVVLDGVIVCPDDRGRPEFARLLRRLSEREAISAPRLVPQDPVTFQAFDILYYGGKSVMGEPLRERRALLQQTIRLQSTLTVPDAVEREGIAFFEAARAHGLPGIIAKEADATYVPGACTRSWLAMRVYERDKFVIAGCTYGRRSRAGRTGHVRGPFDSLLLGQYDIGGNLRFVGEVQGPFDRDTATGLTGAMDTLATRACPFADEPAASRLIFWSRPELVASIRFAARSPGGSLRFPIFECLRHDVPPLACRLPVAPAL